MHEMVADICIKECDLMITFNTFSLKRHIHLNIQYQKKVNVFLKKGYMASWGMESWVGVGLCNHVMQRSILEL